MFSAMCGGFNIEAMGVWRDFGGGQELMEEAFSDYNVHILECPMLNSGPEVWGFSTKEYKTLDDIQGFKMRCMGDGGEILFRIGMSTIFLPGGEIYESLQRGVIDGAEAAAWAGNWGAGHNEVAKWHYASTTRAATDPHQFWVNKDAWDALSSQNQALLEACARANKSWGQNYMANMNVEALQKFIDFGCVIQKTPIEIDQAFVDEATKFYDEKAGADPFYKEVVTSIRNFRDAYMGMIALETPQVEF
jgi:TRAP-type mannitol/chloroaromatic compound transport system substrate-binding protein